jgi:MFS family permease
MVLSGMYLMFYTTGVSFFGFSAFFDAIRLDLGWSRAQVSLGPSIQAAQTGILGPTIGYLTDRLGPRIVTSSALFLGGLGFIVLGLVESQWHYYVAFILIGSGMGATAYVVVATAISNWFIRNRGKALGLTFMGPGFAGLITALLFILIDAYGWRPVAIGTGIGTWVTGIPLALVLRRRPEEYGLRPDGDSVPDEDSDTAASEGEGATSPVEASFTVREVLRSRSYWFYVVALGAQQVAITAMVVHHIPALVSFGLSMPMAGLMVVVFTVASLPMRFFSGYLADRYNPRLVLVSMLGFQLVGGIIFLMVTNVWVAVLFEVIYGTGWGGSNAARLSLQAEYWGRSIFGSLMGLQVGVGALGGLFAPVFVGWVADVSDYRWAFLTVVVPLVVATTMVLFMRRPAIVEPIRETA